jgi:hypothetical protein
LAGLLKKFGGKEGKKKSRKLELERYRRNKREGE